MKHLRMIPVRLVSFVLAFAASLATSIPGYSQENSLPADAIAQRFLAHLDRNQPIAGVFEIQTTISQIEESIEEKRKAGFVPEASKQVLVCRWAWTAKREVCEQLEGSKDAPHRFLALPEGTLIGYPGGKQYNLFPPGKPRANITRPSLFYYLNGVTFWNPYLASAKYTLDRTTDQTPSGTVNLIAMEGTRKTVLTLDPKTGKLYAAEIYYDGKRLWNLSIDEFASSLDGRLFPSKARISVYNNDLAKPFRTLTLTARRIWFPSAAEIGEQFKLPIPAGALIGDRVLNAAIETERTTEASEIITGDVPRKPFSPPPDQASTLPRSRFQWVLLIIFLAAPVIVYGVRCLRARRASPRAGP